MENKSAGARLSICPLPLHARVPPQSEHCDTLEGRTRGGLPAADRRRAAKPPTRVSAAPKRAACAAPNLTTAAFWKVEKGRAWRKPRRGSALAVHSNSNIAYSILQGCPKQQILNLAKQPPTAAFNLPAPPQCPAHRRNPNTAIPSRGARAAFWKVEKGRAWRKPRRGSALGFLANIAAYKGNSVSPKSYSSCFLSPSAT